MNSRMLIFVISFFAGIGFVQIEPILFRTSSMTPLWHPVGYTNNPSKISGRTGYQWFRPFSNKFPSWFDIGLPVALGYESKTVSAFDLPIKDKKFETDYDRCIENCRQHMEVE